MNHPPTYVRTFSLHKVRENCPFLDHPPTPTSLRNIKMAPNSKCLFCENIWLTRNYFSGFFPNILFRSASMFKSVEYSFSKYIILILVFTSKYFIGKHSFFKKHQSRKSWISFFIWLCLMLFIADSLRNFGKFSGFFTIWEQL